MTDMSDAATGLPPLDQPIEEDTLWAMAFSSGQADVLSPVDRGPSGAMILSVRGLVNSRDGSPEWGQMHIAFPHGSVSRLRDRIDDYLREYPE